MKSKVVVIDRGWDRIQQDIKQLDKAYTKVGVQTGETTTDGASMVEIGAWNEFGTKRIPERPHHRANFDKNKDKASNLAKKLYNKVLQGVYRPKKAIGLLGEWYEGTLKMFIRDLKTPPNSPYTIAKKGSDNPLIDTGQYINSIRHEDKI